MARRCDHGSLLAGGLRADCMLKVSKNIAKQGINQLMIST
jgi:hypothetical protein